MNQTKLKSTQLLNCWPVRLSYLFLTKTLLLVTYQFCAAHWLIVPKVVLLMFTDLKSWSSTVSLFSGPNSYLRGVWTKFLMGRWGSGRSILCHFSDPFLTSPGVFPFLLQPIPEVHINSNSCKSMPTSFVKCFSVKYPSPWLDSPGCVRPLSCKDSTRKRGPWSLLLTKPSGENLTF